MVLTGHAARAGRNFTTTEPRLSRVDEMNPEAAYRAVIAKADSPELQWIAARALLGQNADALGECAPRPSVSYFYSMP